jgi:hypothetical protein
MSVFGKGGSESNAPSARDFTFLKLNSAVVYDSSAVITAFESWNAWEASLRFKYSPTAVFGLGVMAQAQNATVPAPSHITATAAEKAKTTATEKANNAAAPATKAYKKQTKQYHKYHKKAGVAVPEGPSTGAQ